MIVLFTDFGPRGPYVGQMQAVLAQLAPNVPVITPSVPMKRKSRSKPSNDVVRPSE